MLKQRILMRERRDGATKKKRGERFYLSRLVFSLDNDDDDQNGRTRGYIPSDC